MTRAHERIEQRAAEWIVRLDRESTPEELRVFEAWLNDNPRHRAAFLRLSTAWRRADLLRRLADPGEPADPDLLAPEHPPADESITEPSAVEHPRGRRWRPSWTRALAAALIGVVVGVAFWMMRDFMLGKSYTTGVGELHRFTLSDGSSLALNTNSKVVVRYQPNERRIRLVRGEALFDVAPDVQRPFVVTAGETVIRAVGTSFSVRLRSDETVDVLVSEGKVAINPPSDTLLAANGVAHVRGKQVISRVALPDEIARRLAWTEGRLVFSGETLGAAAAEFNRYNHKRLVIADPSIATLKIGGAFNATNPDEFAAALETTADVRAQAYRTLFGTEIRLTRRMSH
ncbi:MAG: FecR domain-containing protein [Steroidobacteraceae bacterium]|nr:FecR domain-containing protein [Steroidobacteraceae bacterium]